MTRTLFSLLRLEVKNDAEQKGSSDDCEEFSCSLGIESLVEEVKDQAAAKVDDAKEKVAELAADATEKGQGENDLCEKTFP